MPRQIMLVLVVYLSFIAPGHGCISSCMSTVRALIMMYPLLDNLQNWASKQSPPEDLLHCELATASK